MSDEEKRRWAFDKVAHRIGDQPIQAVIADAREVVKFVSGQGASQIGNDFPTIITSTMIDATVTACSREQL